jgi:alpha-glucosidase
MLTLTLPGVPTVYYGDEIGMENVPITPDQRTDMSYQEGIFGGRDPFRTPMQWDATEYSGFSSVKPWLPLAKDYKKRNIKTERHQADSVFTLYRHLLFIRNRDETMIKGDYKEHLIDEKKNVLVYGRNYESSSYIVALNFSNRIRRVRVPYKAHHVVLSTQPTKQPKVRVHGWVTLRPYEGLILYV